MVTCTWLKLRVTIRSVLKFLMVVIVIQLHYSIVNGGKTCSTSVVGPTAYPSFSGPSTAMETETIGSDFDHSITADRRHERYFCKQNNASVFLSFTQKTSFICLRTLKPKS